MYTRRIPVRFLFRIYVILLSSFFCFQSAFAGGLLDFYYQKFSRDQDTRVGTICEKIAKEELKEKYSPEYYSIFTNLIYLDDYGNEKGEIDLLVMENGTELVDLVVEVKCWPDREEALERSREQLDRFKQHLENLIYKANHRCDVRFVEGDTWLIFPCEKFTKGTLYWSVFPKYRNQQFRGFSLPFYIDEIERLSQLLLRR